MAYRIALIGYGNIGRAAEHAIIAAPDMELAGIYHHNDSLDSIKQMQYYSAPLLAKWRSLPFNSWIRVSAPWIRLIFIT